MLCHWAGAKTLQHDHLCQVSTVSHMLAACNAGTLSSHLFPVLQSRLRRESSFNTRLNARRLPPSEDSRDRYAVFVGVWLWLRAWVGGFVCFEELRT